MTSTPPEADSPPQPRWSALAALGWGFACAVCAGGLWLAAFVLGDVRIYALNDTLRRHSSSISFVTALNSALGGLLGEAFLKLFDATRSNALRALAFGGAVTGAIGGALTIPAVILCRPWLNPLVSSMVLWCFIGFFAGVGAYGLSLWVPTTGPGQQHNENTRTFPIARLLYFLALAAFAFLVFTLSTARYLE